MEFNAVIGNPPYQRTVENTSDEGLYSYFMDTAFLLGSVVTLITPAKFLFDQGKTKAEWRKKVLADEYLSVANYYEDGNYCFPGHVEIKGGLAITLRNPQVKCGSIGVYSRHAIQNDIRAKVLSSPFFRPLTEVMHLQTKFNLTELYLYKESCKDKVGSQGRERRLTTNIFSNLPEVFSERQTANCVPIYGIENSTNRIVRYVLGNLLDESESLGSYKVLVTAHNGNGMYGEPLSKPFLGEPGYGFTQSFIGIGTYDSKSDADATLKYIKTKFSRALLGLLKSTQDNPKEVWRFIPLQDFTAESDIDWTKPIPEIDQQLYKKYGLTDDEIKYIENTIKPMT